MNHALLAPRPLAWLVYPPPDEARPSAVRIGMNETDSPLAELYRRYAPAIYAHCRRVLQSQAAARDATQETFVRVLSRSAILPDGDEALRYLYRISTNVCLNQIRQRRVHERATPALVARAAAGGSTEAGHANRQFVIALLDRCDETAGAIAIMHYIDGMSQVEIAEVLGITRRTVFNRLRKLEALALQLMGTLPDATKGTS